MLIVNGQRYSSIQQKNVCKTWKGLEGTTLTAGPRLKMKWWRVSAD